MKDNELNRAGHGQLQDVTNKKGKNKTGGLLRGVKIEFTDNKIINKVRKKKF